MGRRKIEIKAITHERTRSTTFTKRKNGLFKKAYELGVLCSVKIAVVVFEKRPGQEEKVYEYCSGDVPDIIHSRLKFTGPTDTKGPSHFIGKPIKVELDGDDDDDDDDDNDIAIKSEPDAQPEVPASPPRKKPRVIAPYPPSSTTPTSSYLGPDRRPNYPVSSARFTPPPTPPGLSQDQANGPIQLPPLPFQISVTLPPNLPPPSNSSSVPPGYPYRASDRSILPASFHGQHPPNTNPNNNSNSAMNLFDMLLRVASAAGGSASLAPNHNGITFDIAPPPSSETPWAWPTINPVPPSNAPPPPHPSYPGGGPGPGGDDDWLNMLLSSSSSNEVPNAAQPQTIPPHLTRILPPPPGYNPADWESHLRSQLAGQGSNRPMPTQPMPTQNYPQSFGDNQRAKQDNNENPATLSEGSGDDGTLPLLFSPL